MKAAVRQMRGPGMNLGLKKPRKTLKAPQDAAKSAKSTGGKKAKTSTTSYLPPAGPMDKPRRSRG